MTNPTVAVTAATSMASTTWRQGRWIYLQRERRNEGGTRGGGQDHPQPGLAHHIRHMDRLAASATFPDPAGLSCALSSWQSYRGDLGREASGKSSFAQPAPADLPASPTQSQAQLPGKGWRDLAGGTVQSQAQKAAACEWPRGVMPWKLLQAPHCSTATGHPSLRPRGQSWCSKSW